MSGTNVTDITHFLDDEGEVAAGMPSPARQLASFLVLVIDAVTQDIPTQDHDTRIRCRGDGCQGSILASLKSANDRVSWDCPDCDLNGVISNWQGTKWDQQANRVV